MKKVHIAFAVIIMTLAFLSFQKENQKSQEEMMKEYIDDKIAKLKIREWNKCYEKARADAVAYVDTIIDRQIRNAIQDTFAIPAKPPKPAKPYDTLQLDTTPIVPILKRGN